MSFYVLESNYQNRSLGCEDFLPKSISETLNEASEVEAWNSF
jgi:hypothetical protein